MGGTATFTHGRVKISCVEICKEDFVSPFMCCASKTIMRLQVHDVRKKVSSFFLHAQPLFVLFFPNFFMFFSRFRNIRNGSFHEDALVDAGQIPEGETERMRVSDSNRKRASFRGFEPLFPTRAGGRAGMSEGLCSVRDTGSGRRNRRQYRG
jgi:hypothetical protein